MDACAHIARKIAFTQTLVEDCLARLSLMFFVGRPRVGALFQGCLPAVASLPCFGRRAHVPHALWRAVWFCLFPCRQCLRSGLVFRALVAPHIPLCTVAQRGVVEPLGVGGAGGIQSPLPGQTLPRRYRLRSCLGTVARLAYLFDYLLDSATGRGEVLAVKHAHFLLLCGVARLVHQAPIFLALAHLGLCRGHGVVNVFQ